MSGKYAQHAQSHAADGHYACGSSPGEEYCPDRQVFADKKRIWRLAKGALKDFFFNLRESQEYHETHNHAIFRTNETPAASTFARSIEQAPKARNLGLRFSKSNTPVYNTEYFYSGDQVRNEDGSALLVELVDIETGQLVEDGAGSSAKFKILVLMGDFESDNYGNSWPPATSSLTKSIVKPRDGKKKLLAGGDLTVTLKGGKGNLSTELYFTDNSSWNRSKKFRLALQLLSGCSSDGLHIREAITEPFAVKDKRGKQNMKRKAPSISEPVCRLPNIANVLSQRLNEKGIYTVADFLRASEEDPEKLQHVTLKMSDKKFKVTLEMARKSRDELMGAPAVAHSTPAIPGAADQVKVALVSVENEGSEDPGNIRSDSLQEQHEQDSFLKDVAVPAAYWSDNMQQYLAEDIWQTIS